MSDLKARLQKLQRALDDSLGKAAGYQDPGLNNDGLAAKRQELAKAARAAAGPPLAALRTEVASAAQTSADKAAATLPKAGTNADATARLTVKWAQVAMRLDAGMPLAQVLASADAETAHAIREFAPSWVEAHSFKAGAGRGGSRPQEAPDHTGLRRAIDERLAGLSGKGAVSALAESRAAAGEAAYFRVHGERLDSLIAGTTPSSTMLGAAIAAEHAEQLAIHGQAPDDAPTATEATESGAA